MTDEERERKAMAALDQFTYMGAQLAQAFSAWIEQAMPAIEAVMSSVWTCLDRAYERAGRPYGEGQDALMRWLNDVCAATKLQQADHYERIREWSRLDLPNVLNRTAHLPVPEPRPLNEFLPEPLRATMASSTSED